MLAKDYTLDQMKLRLEVVKFLEKEGFRPEKPDADGDTRFEKDGVRYYAIIDHDWVSPYLITLYAEFVYDENCTQGIIKNSISSVGQQFKTIKLYPLSKSFTFRSDMFCENSDVFKSTFYAVMTEMEKAHAFLNKRIHDGLADVDMNEPDSVYKKALDFFYDDEDEKAFSLFKQLADAGYARAYSYVAISYENGYGVAKNTELMEKYYEKGIDAGYLWCAYRLANYLYGINDCAKAFTYYMKCGTNENPYMSKALYMVGYMQEMGKGTDKNLSQAILSYKKSVQYSTDLECDARLALVRLGENIEKKEDFVDATQTMLMGLSADEMYNTGCEYEQGLNNRFVCLPKAYAFFKAAADRSYTKAYSKMGEIYISKYYPFKDKSKSDKFYQKAFKIYKAIESVDGVACCELGYMYQNGCGIDKNIEKAKYYYKSGSLLGDRNASWRFGLMCKDEMDYTEAFSFFNRAAENGQGMAMYELAKLYEQGLGTITNRDKAIEWYTKCSKSSYPSSTDAKNALKRLNSNDGKE